MEFGLLLLSILVILNLSCVATEISLRFVFIVELQEPELSQQIGRALKVTENMRPELRLNDYIVHLDRENEDESYQKLCGSLSNGASMMVDLSWSPWEAAADLAERSGVPIVRSLLCFQQLLTALDDYLEMRNATDAALILPSEIDVDKALYHLLGSSNVRVWVHAGLTRDAARALKTMRPEPGFHAIIGDSTFVTETYRRAVKEKLVRRDYRWNLVLTDYSASSLELTMPMPTMVLSADPSECCKLIGQAEDCSCPIEIQRRQYALNALLAQITDTYGKLETSLPALITKYSCEDPQTSPDVNVTRDRVYRQFADDLALNNDTAFYWDDERSGLYLRSHFVLKSYTPEEGLENVAAWSADEEFKLLPGVTLQPLRMFFRIGTAMAVPWTLPKLDPDTGQPMFDEDGQPLYEGYCIDLIQKISEVMEFDYEIVTPKTGTFGKKLPNGTWDGVVGDLMKGLRATRLPSGRKSRFSKIDRLDETEFAVAALTMTAEREEVIDFVAPYFEQTGILIVIRKPTRKTSLFKFMTVLRTEVWLSIVAALVLTGFMIWLLDKYSPYSARNNPDAYPYPCREFTLKESFWFALTSFTPQGGGEAPKALSGRTLVAAYWLFVVLMLATFTANLAAFLTVERMQTPVSSLEQLARQSRINYTVVEGSTIHQYFINMKFAEDTLYRQVVNELTGHLVLSNRCPWTSVILAALQMRYRPTLGREEKKMSNRTSGTDPVSQPNKLRVWKEITLNATSDQAQYRVWDYPIREQYGHILLAINASGPVTDATTGFQQVNEHTDADFAFIHDSAEIKYEVTRNCNLTEVGEVFAEQPYAIAVQQGSRLQEHMSRALLDLQKERFLEQLASKYWNESAKQACPDADESEGITLESLGGVFIATLFGLGLAMLTLAWEVFYYKRKEKTEVKLMNAPIDKPKEAFVGGKKNIESKMAEGIAKLRKREKKGGKSSLGKNVTIGDTFRPVGEKTNVSYISVYPKDTFNP